MALISHILDPFTLEIVDPFEVFPFGATPARATPARATPARATPARATPARATPARATPARATPARQAPAYVNIRIDWKETPEAHIIKADLPGLKKEDVTVEVEEGGVLQISGEWTEEQVEENETWHRTERSSGQFVRRFRLPENAKLDHVTATMEHGVLTVTIPKEEVKMPAVKAVQISG